MRLAIGTNFLLRPTNTKLDARTIVPRDDDRREWEASITGGLDMLPLCIEVSEEAWTIADKDNRAHVIFGVVTQNNPMPTTWMLGSDYGERAAWGLMMHTKEFMESFFRRWPRTECFSDARNTTHHRWVKYIGYHLVDIMPYGPQKMTFHHYRREP